MGFLQLAFVTKLAGSLIYKVASECRKECYNTVALMICKAVQPNHNQYHIKYNIILYLFYISVDLEKFLCKSSTITLTGLVSVPMKTGSMK